MPSIFCDTDYTAGDSGSGIAGRLRNQVVCSGVYDNAAADNGIGTVKLQVGIRSDVMGISAGIGLDISQIAHMPVCLVRTRMGLIFRIEMPAGRRAVRRRAIAELMNVEAVFAGTQAHDIGCNLNAVVTPAEVYRTCNIAIPGGVENCNGLIYLSTFAFACKYRADGGCHENGKHKN
jgi:hypothetical protein